MSDHNETTRRPDRFWAGGFLFNPSALKVFLHKRDANTRVNPNKWAFFGGLNEGDETPEECYRREMKEEIGLDIALDNVYALREYLNTDLNTYRIVYYSHCDLPQSAFSLGEGAGFDWVRLDVLGNYDLTDKTREDLLFFVERL